MKIINFRHLLAAMALVLVFSETALFAATIKTSDYWVMQDGYNELFISSTNSEYLTVTYGGYLNYINDDVFQVDYPGPLTQFLKYDAEGNLVYHGATFYDTAYGIEWTYLPYNPQIFFPAQMETGKQYTAKWGRIEYANGIYRGVGSDTFTITIEEERGVSVPAGTFDTYRMIVVDSYVTSTGIIATSYRTYWLARGVGWVKMKLEVVEYELYNPPPVSPLAVTPTSLSLSEYETATLSVSGRTSPYTASSSNPSLATVCQTA